MLPVSQAGEGARLLKGREELDCVLNEGQVGAALGGRPLTGELEVVLYHDFELKHKMIYQKTTKSKFKQA